MNNFGISHCLKIMRSTGAQRGLGDTEGRLRTTQISDFKTKEVSTGRSYTIIISGQLGLGDAKDLLTSAQKLNLKGKKVSAIFIT